MSTILTEATEVDALGNQTQALKFSVENQQQHKPRSVPVTMSGLLGRDHSSLFMALKGRPPAQAMR